MILQKKLVRGILPCVALLCLVQIVAAELLPEQIGIIAVAGSRTSRDMARYYADARGIPRSQIFLIRATPGENLSRFSWEAKVRPSIQRWILQNRLETKLRCLVTVWDVPLKIGKQSVDSRALRERTAYLQSEREARVGRLVKLIDNVNQLLPGAQPSHSVALSTESSIAELTAQLQASFQAAQKRFTDAQSTRSDMTTELRSLQQAIAASGGINSTILFISQNIRGDGSESDAKNQEQLNIAKGRLIGLTEGRAELQSLPPSVPRDERILSVLGKIGGLVATVKWIDAQLQLLVKNETYASFDSELSLLFWPDYQLNRWQPNVLHHRFDGTRQRWLKTTLMVSRLEAPTAKLTARLIDTAKEVEADGLRGTVYLDARGIGRPGQSTASDSSATYDLSLRNLAAELQRYTPAKVILDSRQRLFQAGECPDAALYCGWYSLAKYIDAFDWVPGAVGYHMASGEANTLRNPKSRVWCKRMLEEGVCATLGPVHEPYLHAMPLPEEFFVVLMSGRYTLAETYYRTKPFNSWVMVLVGDPLYNPFKNNPQFTADSIPEPWRRLIGAVQASP